MRREGAAAAIRDARGRLLLVGENYDRRRYGFPGGAVEAGETALDTVVRETREETGATIAVESVIGVYRLETGFTATLFQCSLVDGVPAVPQSGEIALVDGFDLDDIPQPTTNLLHHALADVRDGRQGVVQDALPRIN